MLLFVETFYREIPAGNLGLGVAFTVLLGSIPLRHVLDAEKIAKR